jgi:hypothetical protein
MIFYKTYSIDVCNNIKRGTKLLCINCTRSNTNDGSLLPRFNELKRLADNHDYENVWKIVSEDKYYTTGTIEGLSDELGVCPFSSSKHGVYLLKVQPAVFGDLWHPITLFFNNGEPICKRCWRYKGGNNKSS